jgi:predicted nuclease with TOPRIM domain
MNFDSLNRITKRFLLNEGNPKIGLSEYLRSLGVMLEIFRPRNKSERSALNTAKQNLKEIKRHVSKLNEELSLLQEKVNLLEESNEKNPIN